jgi:outer membrane protein assembly factor BamC
MKKHLFVLSFAVMAGVLSGCSGFSILPETKKLDYKSSGKVPSLEVPPDLSQVARDERYTVPDGAGKGTATFSGYSADRSVVKSDQSSVLPKIDNIRVERVGSERWLVVAQPADKVWMTVKDFWQEMGFIIKTESPEAGIMETDWAENRAKIPTDVVRNMLGKLLESLYSTGERDKFRTRLEPGKEPGTTDIFISHRGMEEVYTSGVKDDTRWQPRPPDPELEAEMLRRLMVRLGTEEKRAESAIASAQSEPRAKLAQVADGSGAVEVQESFDRAWRRVGLTLDRIGFTVEDRDRSKGIYFVRYVDPEIDNKKEYKGWFSKFAFWRGGDTGADSKIQYRIHVREAGNATVVQVLSREGGVDKSETARKILNLLYEQLK